MNLKAQRAALLKEAQEIAVKAAGNYTSEQADRLEVIAQEVRSLNEKIELAEKSAGLIDQLGNLGMGSGEAPGDERGDTSDPTRAKSIGDFFLRSLKGRSIKNLGKFSTGEFKAPTDDHFTGGAYGPLLTDVDRSFALPFRRPLVIADLMGTGNVSGNAITYPVFGALEGATEWVSEGGQKPQLHVGDPDWRTDGLGEVAGWFRITDDMSEDLPYVVSEIEGTARYDLLTREEAALLQGSGISPTPEGVLNRDGVQTETATDEEDNADALFRAMTKVQTATGFMADGFAINPLDYQRLRLRRDGNGQYFGGGFFQGQYGNGAFIEQPPLWGLRTVVTAAVPVGVAVAGAWQTAKVFRKGGLRVESTNSHEDDFTNDKITIRLRSRVGLQVKYPAAFVQVNLASPTAGGGGSD